MNIIRIIQELVLFAKEKGYNVNTVYLSAGLIGETNIDINSFGDYRIAIPQSIRPATVGRGIAYELYAPHQVVEIRKSGYIIEPGTLEVVRSFVNEKEISLILA